MACTHPGQGSGAVAPSAAHRSRLLDGRAGASGAGASGVGASGVGASGAGASGAGAIRIALVLALGSSTGACTTHQSDEILTQGIYASITSQAFGDGSTTVGATLYLDNPASLDFVELVGDDQLVAWSDGNQEVVMSESSLFGATSYSTVFGYDDPGTTFHVGLNRSVDTGAPDSSMTLPDPFEITSPAGGDLSRAGDLTIEWDPADSGDQMSWTIDGPCLQRTGGNIDGDPGSATVSGGTVTVGDAYDPDTATCEGTLEVWRTRPGDLDPGYGQGGTIDANQVRRLTFNSVP